MVVKSNRVKGLMNYEKTEQFFLLVYKSKEKSGGGAKNSSLRFKKNWKVTCLTILPRNSEAIFSKSGISSQILIPEYFSGFWGIMSWCSSTTRLADLLFDTLESPATSQNECNKKCLVFYWKFWSKNILRSPFFFFYCA